MRKSGCPYLLCIAVLLLSGFAGCGKNVDEPYRIGVISGIGSGPLPMDVIKGFVDGMTERGYEEGEDVVFDIRTTSMDPEEQREAVGSILADGVDMIYVFPTEAALFAKEEARDAGIPVIFSVSSTEGTGLIDSIESPGDDITGIRYPTVEVALKQYELMRDLVPGMRRLAIPYDPQDPRIGYEMTPIRTMADDDGIDLVEIEAGSVEELLAHLEELTVDVVPDIDAVMIIIDYLGILAAPRINEFCLEKNLPFGGYPSSPSVPKTLFSVGIDYYGTGRIASSLADKVIRGVPAGNLPVRSSELRVQINHARAAELGLEIPQAVLLTADEIIRE